MCNIAVELQLHARRTARNTRGVLQGAVKELRQGTIHGVLKQAMKGRFQGALQVAHCREI